MMLKRVLPGLLVAVLVSGCASIPENISTPIAGPEVAQARANPQAHTGERVRWGGTISNVRNLENRTVITVVARPLTRRGEPLGDRAATGRFLAEFDRFLDPEVYKSGRRITVVGRFTGIRQGRIDQYIYDYPVVRGEALYMWEEYVRRDPRPYWPYYGRYPYWHDPYDPFGPYPWWW